MWSWMIFIAFTSLTALSAPDLHEYRVRDFAAEPEFESCKRNIGDLSLVFAEESQKQGFQVEIVESSCSRSEISKGNLDGIILYRAEKVVPITSTRDSGSFEPDAQGFFQNEAACLADLSRVERIFQEETHLTPFVKHCYARTPFAGRPSYAWHLDAVGESTRNHYVIGTSGLNISKTSAVAWLEEIKENLKRLSVRPTIMVLVSDGLLQRLTLRYFGKARLRMHVEMELKFESTKACYGQLSNLREITSYLENPPVGFTCEDANGPMKSRMVILSLTPSGSKEYPTFLLSQIGGDYGSRENCEKSLATVFSQPSQYLGGVCTADNDRFQIIGIRPHIVAHSHPF